MIHITITKPTLTLAEMSAYLKEIAEQLENGKLTNENLDWYTEGTENLYVLPPHSRAETSKS